MQCNVYAFNSEVIRPTEKQCDGNAKVFIKRNCAFENCKKETLCILCFFFVVVVVVLLTHTGVIIKGGSLEYLRAI